MSQVHNKHANALATLAFKIDVPDETVEVRIIQKTLWAIVVDLIPDNPIDEQKWRYSII